MGDSLDKFDKLPLAQKVLLLLLLMAGLFVAFYLSVYSPLEDEIKQQRAQVDSLRNQAAELQANTQEEALLRQQILELCQRRESFLERLPPEAEIPSLLQSIHQKAMQSSLDIQSFTRQDDVPEPNYTRIPVNMEVIGSYDQIADFFYFIGRQQRIVNVSGISLNVMQTTNTWRSSAELSDSDVPAFMRDPTQVGPPQLRVSYLISTYFADATSGGSAGICAEFAQQGAP